MGKKQIAVLNKMKVQFIEGATGKGHRKTRWKNLERLGSILPNMHSTNRIPPVTLLWLYQTAYLRPYPSEYMAAVLNHAGSIDKITFFMEECKRIGLKVLGPDINESQSGFAVNRKGRDPFRIQRTEGCRRIRH